MVLPAALSGIIAAFILAVSRAVGETMIVAIAAGAGPNLTLDPTKAAETMTGNRGHTIEALPLDKILSILKAHKSIP